MFKPRDFKKISWHNPLEYTMDLQSTYWPNLHHKPGLPGTVSPLGEDWSALEVLFLCSTLLRLRNLLYSWDYQAVRGNILGRDYNSLQQTPEKSTIEIRAPFSKPLKYPLSVEKKLSHPPEVFPNILFCVNVSLRGFS